jgi:hypothetical protein
MAAYDLRRADDRALFIKDRQAEIDAIDLGLWPRDINDVHRWTPPYEPYNYDPGRPAKWARRMCLADIAYVNQMPPPDFDDLPRREQ